MSWLKSAPTHSGTHKVNGEDVPHIGLYSISDNNPDVQRELKRRKRRRKDGGTYPQ